MSDVTNRSRVSAGVPTGGEFAREQRGENDDLNPYADTDFDHVADMQGWDDDSCLRAARDFISTEHMGERLDEFAAAAAYRESGPQCMVNGYMDFDEIAEVQGWDQISCLETARDFIASEGKGEQLGEFAAARAAEENDGAASVPTDPGQLPRVFAYQGNNTWTFGDDMAITFSPNAKYAPKTLPLGFLEKNQARIEAIRAAGLRGTLELENDGDMYHLRCRLPHSGQDFGVYLDGPTHPMFLDEGIADIPRQVRGAVFQGNIGSKRIVAYQKKDGGYRVFDSQATHATVKDPRMGNYQVRTSAGTDFRDGDFVPMANGADNPLQQMTERANWSRLGEAMGVSGGRAKVEAKIRSAIAGIDTHPDMAWFNEGKKS